VSKSDPRNKEVEQMTKKGIRERAPLKLAGALLFTAGAAIFMGIITAEALYPAAYSTAANTISDLGGTRPPDSVVLQPSAAIFDITMLVTGTMIIVAAWLVHRAFRHRAVTISLAAYGIGVLGIGVFPGNTTPHPWIATFVFVAAGVAAVLAYKVEPAPLRQISVVLGTITLASLVLGSYFLEWGPVAELGEGGIERWVPAGLKRCPERQRQGAGRDCWRTLIGAGYQRGRAIPVPLRRVCMQPVGAASTILETASAGLKGCVERPLTGQPL
jgi:hypothetical membrane protein